MPARSPVGRNANNTKFCLASTRHVRAAACSLYKSLAPGALLVVRVVSLELSNISTVVGLIHLFCLVLNTSNATVEGTFAIGTLLNFAFITSEILPYCLAFVHQVTVRRTTPE